MPIRGDTFEPGDVVYSGESRGIVVSVDVADAVFSVDWNENYGPITYPLDATFIRKAMPWET
jgi:hypothetical protein